MKINVSKFYTSNNDMKKRIITIYITYFFINKKILLKGMACMSDKLYVHISINDRDLFETAWVEYTSLNNYNTTTYILP